MRYIVHVHSLLLMDTSIEDCVQCSWVNSIQAY